MNKGENMQDVNNFMTELGRQPLVHMTKPSDNEFKFTFTGGLLKALDKLTAIEAAIDRYLGERYNVKTIYGDGLDVTFKVTEK